MEQSNGILPDLAIHDRPGQRLSAQSSQEPCLWCGDGNRSLRSSREELVAHPLRGASTSSRWWLATLLEIVLSCFDLLVRELQSDFTSSGTLLPWLALPPRGCDAVAGHRTGARILLDALVPFLASRRGVRRRWVASSTSTRGSPVAAMVSRGSVQRARLARGPGRLGGLRLHISQRNPGRGASKDDR